MKYIAFLKEAYISVCSSADQSKASGCQVAQACLISERQVPLNAGAIATKTRHLSLTLPQGITWFGPQQLRHPFKVELQLLGQDVLHWCSHQAALLPFCTCCCSSCLLSTLHRPPSACNTHKQLFSIPKSPISVQKRHPYTGTLNSDRLGTVKTRFYNVEMF